MRSGPELEAARFDEPDVQALVVAQQTELRALDGQGDIGPTRDAEMFKPPSGAFLVARSDGRPVLCGGVCRFDDTRAELKRMYVDPALRGQGHGRRLLAALEDEARRLGYTAIVLETGEQQDAALGLYASAGYVPIPCYGVYAQRAMSRCFEKQLRVA